jgi:insertion element IS1 protein InsB
VTVEIRRVEAAEVDEMWSFVQRKAHQRWLWHAIDHLRGVGLAYAFGSRADAVFVELQKWLKPFGLVHFYTDGAGVYERHLPASAHTVGKSNTQQIERKHLTLRTRINRLNQTTQHSYTQAASCEISVGVVDAACSTATAAVTSGV